MKTLLSLAAMAAVVLGPVAVGAAAEISGDYVEARTCDVYTGPCFANSEVGLAGREAVMAWHVDEGTYNGVDLAGLSIAAAVRGKDTLAINGNDATGTKGPFVVKPFPVKAVVYVDQRATSSQRTALVALAKAEAGRFLDDVVRVEAAPISFSVEHLDGKAYVTVGKVAQIQTRAIGEEDCICTNQTIFYPTLADAENISAAVTVEHRFTGTGLGTTWSSPAKRSAILGTFAR
jgi:hypothetical protein